MELNPHTDKKMFWEHKLMELLNKDNEDASTVHFEYTDNKPTQRGDFFPGKKKMCLKIKTYNPKKDASFLLMQTEGYTHGECAEAAYEELIRMRSSQGYSSYTLTWYKKSASTSMTSYFFAANEFEVLTKFYSEMGPENVVFHSLKVNPIA